MIAGTYQSSRSWCAQQDKGGAHLKRWLFKSVRAVTTLVCRSVAYLCSSKEEETMPVHHEWT